jgi:3-oxoacyl-[acyl-carrier-protein] synthase-1
MGIWSCIGQDLQTVTESLRQGRSGIIFDPKRIEYGLQSGLVGNVPRPDLKPFLPRKFRATMSEDAEYAYMAARRAFEQARIDDEFLKQNEVGIIFGNDGNTHMLDYVLIMEEEVRKRYANNESAYAIAASMCAQTATHREWLVFYYYVISLIINP